MTKKKTDSKMIEYINSMSPMMDIQETYMYGEWKSDSSKDRLSLLQELIERKIMEHDMAMHTTSLHSSSYKEHYILKSTYASAKRVIEGLLKEVECGRQIKSSASEGF